MQIQFKYADLLDDLAFKLVFGQESTTEIIRRLLSYGMSADSIASALNMTIEEVRGAEE